MRQALVLLAALLLPGLAVVPRLAAADDVFPARSVKLIVPFPAGGPTDVMGRILGDKLSAAWGQPVVVENRPGAGTVVGTNLVAKSKPDGYTLGVVISAHTVNPGLRPNLPYDTLRDFSNISLLVFAPFVIAVNASYPADNLRQLIDATKRQPKEVTYATPGTGTMTHLATELLAQQAGIQLVHVPYNGSAPALTDVIAGRVPIMVDVLYSTMPHVREGKLKALAVMSPKRLPAYPEFPTVAETLPGFEARSVIGLVGPAGIPRPVVDKIAADIAAAERTDDFRRRMQDLVVEPVGSTPEEFDAFIRADVAKWDKIIKAAGITIE
ncbi:MAG TPA: tripartite tricarboxylate transporter substrate binding protein [Alphaproteobacteria bacterium]